MVDIAAMQSDSAQNYGSLLNPSPGMPVRQNKYDFQQESHFYVDVLTKGGDLCETHEDGTYVIVSDGSGDDESAEEVDTGNERPEPVQISPPEDLNSQYKQT